MSTIQDILYAKALADAQYRETDNTGMAIGALTGTALGAAAAPMKNTAGLARSAQYGKTRIGPVEAGSTARLYGARTANLGRRMAGGLVGAIVGGGLGEGVKQLAMRESPAAGVLARIQAQGGMTEYDRYQIEALLKDFYNNPGMM